MAGAFAGLRPLLDTTGAHSGTAPRTADLSRRHAVLTSSEGVVTVVGGKLTTYRRMAEDAVDTAVRVRGLPAGPSPTASLPLVARRRRTSSPNCPRPAVSSGGTAPRRRPCTRSACGTPGWASRAARVSGHRRRAALGPAPRGALDDEDVLDRRTRIGLVPADRAAALDAVRGLVDGALSQGGRAVRQRPWTPTSRSE
ncbi:hypothetical protein GCM10023238_39570 [Streptomyces heliomycini]